MNNFFWTKIYFYTDKLFFNLLKKNFKFYGWYKILKVILFLAILSCVLPFSLEAVFNYSFNFDNPDIFLFKPATVITCSLILFVICFIDISEKIYKNLIAKKYPVTLLATVLISLIFIISFIKLFIDLGEGKSWNIIFYDFYIDEAAIAMFAIWFIVYMEQFIRYYLYRKIFLYKIIRPKYARKIINSATGETAKVLVSELKKGDLISVEIGEIVPIDGTLIDQETYFLTKHWNNNNSPYYAAKNTNVFTGFVNLVNTVTIRLDSEKAHFGISKLTKILEDSMHGNKNSNLTFKRLLIISIVAEIVIAIAAFFISYFFYDQKNNWENFYAGLQISAAVAILSTPLTYKAIINLTLFLNSYKNYKNEIIIKNLEVMDSIKNVDAILIDLDYCLEETDYSIANVTVLNDSTEYLGVLKKLLQHSLDPIAISLTNVLYKVKPANVSKIQNLNEFRMKGEYMGELAYIDYYDSVISKQDQDIITNSIYAKAVLVIGNKVVAGFNPISNYRLNILNALHQFKTKGFEVFVTTSKKDITDLSLLTTVGGDKIYYSISPDKQPEIISMIEEEGYKLVFIGDNESSKEVFKGNTPTITLLKNKKFETVEADIILMTPKLDDIMMFFSERKLRSNTLWTVLILFVMIFITALILFIVFVAQSFFLGTLFFLLLNGLLLATVVFYQKIYTKVQNNY